MIRQMTGNIVAINENFVVVEVYGIGYQIYTPQPNQIGKIGEIVKLFTYLAVRENALDLYGFNTEEELEIFELLMELPKVGPKTALQFLGQASASLIKEAIVENDSQKLSKLSGISKKSAEKIVTGLKDNAVCETWSINVKTSITTNNHTNDAIDALLTLGYSEKEVRQTIQSLLTENPELSDSKELLKTALRHLSK